MNETTAQLLLDELIGELAEEYAERIRRGERPSVEEYARQHPHAANEIRRIFPALQVMAEPLPGMEEGTEPVPSTQDGILGDYRLVCEIGRGGMGVVYEAEQISLGRRVALKILPFAAVLDPRQIQRFKNEALAAAQLDHPHIVNVYGVGCERSVHFYAMRFVEGDSLALVIAQLRPEAATVDGGRAMFSENSERSANHRCATVLHDGSTIPEDTAQGPKERQNDRETTPVAKLTTENSIRSREFFRSAARIGVEIATALDHAHQQGVIHRDVKPSNLLIDAEGKSWITDFGLARVGDANLTMTGDLLGTLRYMSPEQALAKRVLVDHRTDVYSLGVTLYELLTVQPAFPQENRQELLRRIAFDEPASPRNLNPAIPADLETIVLKAINKNPNDRYPTAAELADDLKHFLDDEPIRARRPTIRQRLVKWTRRHLGFVASASAVLSVVVIALGVSTWLLTAKQSELVDERNAARNNADEAQENFELAIKAVDEMLTKVGDEDLADLPHVNKIRREILHRAVDFYEKLCRKHGDNPKVQFATAMAYVRIGAILREMDDFDDAQKSLQRANSLLDALLAGHPENARYLSGAATLHRNRGLLFRRISRMSEAEQECRSAVKCLQHIPPAERYDDGQRQLGLSHQLMATIQKEQGRLREAENGYRTARSILQSLTQKHQEDVAYHLELWAVEGNLASLLNDLGKPKEALQANRRCVTETRKLVDRFNRHARCRLLLANNLTNLGVRLMLHDKEYAESEKRFREALALYKMLASEFPGVSMYRESHISALANLGGVLGMQKRRNESRNYLDEAIATAKRLVEQFPGVAAYEHILGGAYNNVGVITHQHPTTRQQSAAFYRRAIAHHAAASRLKPKHPKYLNNLANSYRNLALSLACSGQLKESFDAIRKLQAALGENWDAHLKVQKCFQSCIRCILNEKGLMAPELRLRQRAFLEEAGRHLDRVAKLQLTDAQRKDVNIRRVRIAFSLNTVARALVMGGKFEEAEAACRTAIRRLEAQYKANPNDIQARAELAKSMNHLVNLLGEAGKNTETISEAERAVPFIKKLIHDHPRKAAYQVLLGGTLDGYATVLAAAGDHDKAATLLRTAIGHENVALAIDGKHEQAIEFLHSHYVRLIPLLTRLRRHNEAFRAADAFRTTFNLPWKGVLNAANVLRQATALLKPPSLVNRYESQISTQLDKLAEMVPEDDGQRATLARDADILARKLTDSGLTRAALPAFAVSLKVRQSRHAAQPNDETVRAELAVGHYNYALFLSRLPGGKAKWGEAAGHAREAARIRAELIPSAKDPLQRRFSVANSWFLLGNILANIYDSEHPRDVEGGRTAYGSAIERLEQLHREYPKDTKIHMQLAMAFNNRGALMFNAKRPKAAEADYRKAIDHRRQLLRRFPKSSQHHWLLSMVESNLAKILLDSGRLVECRKTIDAARMHLLPAFQRHRLNPDIRALTSVQHELLATVMEKSGPPPNGRPFEEQAAYWRDLGEAWYVAERFRQAVSSLERSLKFGKESPEALLMLAISCARQRDPRKARAWLGRFESWERRQKTISADVRRLKQFTVQTIARLRSQSPRDPVVAPRPRRANSGGAVSIRR